MQLRIAINLDELFFEGYFFGYLHLLNLADIEYLSIMIKFRKSIMYVVSLPVVDSAIMQQITITVV